MTNDYCMLMRYHTNLFMKSNQTPGTDGDGEIPKSRDIHTLKQHISQIFYSYYNHICTSEYHIIKLRKHYTCLSLCVRAIQWLIGGGDIVFRFRDPILVVYVSINDLAT